jgi:tRNA modification GTPase
MDMNTLTHDEIETAVSHIRSLNKEGEIMLLANKSDTYTDGFTSFGMEYGHWNMQTVSSKNKEDITFIKKELSQIAQHNAIDTNQVVITNARHLEALTLALSALEKTQSGLSTNLSGDFIAMDIRQAIHQLGSITGEITSDDLLGNIFKNFCIGK